LVNVLATYRSRTGRTEKMAKAVAEGAREAGACVRLKRVEETDLEGLRWRMQLL